LKPARFSQPGAISPSKDEYFMNQKSYIEFNNKMQNVQNLSTLPT